MIPPGSILISSGSFKDVYTPLEACEMMRDLMISIYRQAPAIEMVPLADGGEYSNEVLADTLNCKKIIVDNVINPYGKIVTSNYLELDRKSAFIGASEILRLSPEEEYYKNPLNLTSYGFGQLISDAIERGYTHIFTGMGGTSTVDGGIGMVQALGGYFYCKGQKINSQDKFLTGKDLQGIDRIEINSIRKAVNQIKLTAVCDARTTINEMHTPTNQKVSKYYDNDRESIIHLLEGSLKQYLKIVSKTIPAFSSWSKKDLSKSNYLGVAGAINLGLLLIFDHRTILGSSYFARKFHLGEKISRADLILTGEGTFDNTLEGKTPVGVSRLAKKYQKPLVLLCGTVGDNFKKYFNPYVSTALPVYVQKQGIDTIISCHSYYDKLILPDDYSERVKLFRKKNKIIFKTGLKQYFTENQDNL